MTRHDTLLVVDDNGPTRYAIKRTLERAGYHVLEAGTGTEGLQTLRGGGIDGLVLDVNLPDMTGFDIVRELRAAPETQLLPVVHVSAASIDTNDLIAGLDNGADAYLPHPVDPGILLATIRTLLRVRDTERALRESEARVREIFTTIGAPIAVVDADLRVLENNDAFARLFDAHVEGKGLTAWFDAGQDEAIEEMRRALSGTLRWRGVLCMRAPGGTRETEWRITPYRDGAGMVFVEDVTDQRRRERSQLAQIDSANTQLAVEIAVRERAESQLVQAQKMDALGKLTGGIAHDFNNLLTSIITGIDLINRQVEAGKPAGVQRFADAALGSARRAASLTHRLLAFARQQPLDARATDINERVHAMDEMLRRTLGEAVVLRAELAYGRMVASVDGNQLDNALLNLVINARDAMPAGGSITLSTRLETVGADGELRPGAYVVLGVADTGEGIPADLLEKVFEPFFTTKPIGKGTGLGLSMIYGFARQSGGRVQIASEVGKGTEVSLWLPVDEGEIEPVKPRGTPVEGGHGEHILIVEDTETLRELACAALESAGYHCTATGDIEAALRHLRGDETLDLLLTDVGMPDMDGRELAKTARAWRPGLPVLFMTGYAENAEEPGTFLEPGVELLLKPFEVATLYERVRGMLG
ncbi:response regulator [Luteibacter yeojuensis]|uniref:histidine kinase n=1 Tax=Luteibacter yeojuensis TaxID=345309 RepID=A0A0F3KZY2_9GAMM|nr:response regulator [Luteibacter yeojuensis]KJV36778.1 histidine kinase [Luteibacter yeojuensis]